MGTFVVIVVIIIVIVFAVNISKGRAQANEERLIENYTSGNYDEVIKSLSKKEFGITADKLMMLADSYFKTGDFENGSKYMKEAEQESTPYRRNEIYKLWGLALYNEKDYEGAISMLQKYDQDEIKEDAKQFNSYDVPKLLGVSFMALEEWELAINAFKKAPLGAKNQNSELAMLNELTGDCYKELGKAAMAKKHYNLALTTEYKKSIKNKIKEIE